MEPIANHLKPGILILNKDADSWQRLWQVVCQLRDQLPRYEVVYINAHGQEKKNSQYFYENYKYTERDPAECAHEIREKFFLEPEALYASDLGFMYRAKDKLAFLERTLFTLEQADKLFDAKNIHYIFMTGGGTMFANAFFELGKRRPPIKCYRIHPLFYLNPDTNIPRYFFADNNLHSLPKSQSIDKTSQRFEKARSQGRQYVEAVSQKQFHPDQFSRKAAEGNFFTPQIGGAVTAAARFVLNRLSRNRLCTPGHFHRDRVQAFLRKSYLDLVRKPLPDKEDFFIFVLHHPYDSQLRLRARHYTDQIALCRLIASNLPYGVKLYVKEHPVQPGMLPIQDLRFLKKTYPQVRYIDYSIPFSQLVHHAKCVITINSTAGLEAMIHNIPVVTLGDAFYSDESFVYRVRDLAELATVFRQILTNPKIPSQEQVTDLLARLLYESEPEPDHKGDVDIPKCIVQGILKRILKINVRTGLAELVKS